MRIMSERVVAAVEFDIVEPVLVMLIFIIIELSLVLYDKALITNASREGARRGSVHDASASTGTVDDGTIACAVYYKLGQEDGNCPPLPPNRFPHLISLGSSEIAGVQISPAAPRTSGDDLMVTVNYTYDFLVLPYFTSFDLCGVTVMKVE